VNDDIDLPHNTIDISYKNIEPREWISDIEEFCLAVLQKLGIRNWEVSLLFCDDSFIAELNETYRSKSGPTDVLSFSQLDGERVDSFHQGGEETIYAGDIVISIPTLMKNTGKINTGQIKREEELKRLIIHGMLHLNGMEHKEEVCEMLILQEKILQELTGGKL
jgi:probable rRNA maturation factor